MIQSIILIIGTTVVDQTNSIFAQKFGEGFTAEEEEKKALFSVFFITIAWLLFFEHISIHGCKTTKQL